MISAGESFCGDDWSKLKVKHPTFKDESLLRYCFSSAYIVSMLHDSLGVALDDQRLKNLLHNLFGFGFRQINYVMFFCLQSRVCK